MKMIENVATPQKKSPFLKWSMPTQMSVLKKNKNHKYFSEDKYHLLLNIQSQYLKSIPRLNAQKLIMNILKEDLKNKIHALEISIE